MFQVRAKFCDEMTLVEVRAEKQNRCSRMLPTIAFLKHLFFAQSSVISSQKFVGGEEFINVYHKKNQKF